MIGNDGNLTPERDDSHDDEFMSDDKAEEILMAAEWWVTTKF